MTPAALVGARRRETHLTSFPALQLPRTGASGRARELDLGAQGQQLLLK